MSKPFPKDYQGMRVQLTRPAVAAHSTIALMQIAEILYSRIDWTDQSQVFDEHAEWDSDTIEKIAEVMYELLTKA